MARPIPELLNDQHFIFKIVDALATLYGLLSLIQNDCMSCIFKSAILKMAFGGGFATMCVFIGMYVTDTCDAKVEKASLMVYGTLNLISVIICLSNLKWFFAFPCLYLFFKPEINMLLAASVSAGCMLGEVKYSKL